ncbi:hypothetical protein AYI69_g870 [Smittium culicis]|uniref:Uncharacterized protein n=1 Tax=Smittium culicis TaxID=133412 RepID=A0A1R1YRX8_9FUNG|nr:hypothetical protein AYI69_g870 [Smittium culicis]
MSVHSVMVSSAIRRSADDSVNSTASSANSSPGMQIKEYRRGWATLPHSAAVFGGFRNFISNSDCDFRGIMHALDHIEEFSPNVY